MRGDEDVFDLNRTVSTPTVGTIRQKFTMGQFINQEIDK